MKTYFVGAHWKHLTEALLMSSYNIFLCKIRENIAMYIVTDRKKSTLSEAMPEVNIVDYDIAEGWQNMPFTLFRH